MNDLPSNNLTGVVLAGGKSTRLGQDKAEIVYLGQTLLQRSIDLLQTMTGQVLVAGRSDPNFGVPSLLDDRPGLGPIGGIITALRLYGGPLMVISCDLPFLSQENLKALIKARNMCARSEVMMTTYQQIETGFIEALVAIYEYKALSLLQESIASGCNKLSRAIPAHLRCHIPYSLQKCSNFFNLNTVQDLINLQGRKL